MQLSKKQKINSHLDELITNIKDYINCNYSNEITNLSIAAQFDYHPYYLNSLFLKYEGLTLHKYITEIKLKYAKELLTSTNKAIYEIALECGFQGASYFSEAFSKNVGIPPTRYRENCTVK